MGTKEYVINRVVVCVSTIFIIILLNFVLFRVMPADPVDILLNPDVGPTGAGSALLRMEEREEMIKKFGLDKPLWTQFVIYLGDVFKGNFGESFSSYRKVTSMISERAVNTIVLMLSANILAILTAIGLGVMAAWKRGTKTDLTSLISALLFTSMPMFWVGGIIMLVFSVRLDWFPLFGTTTLGLEHPNMFAYLSDYLHHLFLPMITLALVSFGGLFLIMRSALLDIFSEDYILTARAIEKKIAP